MAQASLSELAGTFLEGLRFFAMPRYSRIGPGVQAELGARIGPIDRDRSPVTRLSGASIPALMLQSRRRPFQGLAPVCPPHFRISGYHEPLGETLCFRER